MKTNGTWPSQLNERSRIGCWSIGLFIIVICFSVGATAQTRRIRAIDSMFRHAPDLASKQKNFLLLYDQINSMSVEKLGSYLEEGKPLFQKGTVLYDHYESGYCPFYYKSGKIKECIQTAN